MRKCLVVQEVNQADILKRQGLTPIPIVLPSGSSSINPLKRYRLNGLYTPPIRP